VITVPVSGDIVSENDEHFSLTIAVGVGQAGRVQIAAPSALAMIANDEGALPGRLDVNPSSILLMEGDAGTSKFIFDVTRSGNSVSSASVDFAVTGTGEFPASAEDFEAGVHPAGTIHFLPGETRKTITVPALGDTVAEADESFLLVLSNPHSVVLGNLSAAGVIADDDSVSVLRLGDAPARQSGTGGQWATAWTSPQVTAAHKADLMDAAEAWSPVALHGVSPQTLAGGDIYQGDLGVSGRSAATSSVRQEIDGSEALRFDLDHEAKAATVNLSRFYVNDDGGVLVEAGLLRLIDSSGHVVGERAFQADSTSGARQIRVTSTEAFVAVELLAGAYDGEQFVFGAYTDAEGAFGSPISTDPDGAYHGSEFMLDWIEFELPLLGVVPGAGP
jgi:hypothetical protein